MIPLTVSLPATSSPRHCLGEDCSPVPELGLADVTADDDNLTWTAGHHCRIHGRRKAEGASSPSASRRLPGRRRGPSTSSRMSVSVDDNLTCGVAGHCRSPQGAARRKAPPRPDAYRPGTGEPVGNFHVLGVLSVSVDVRRRTSTVAVGGRRRAEGASESIWGPSMSSVM